MNPRTISRVAILALCAAVALAGCGRSRRAARPSEEPPRRRREGRGDRDPNASV